MWLDRFELGMKGHQAPERPQDLVDVPMQMATPRLPSFGPSTRARFYLLAPFHCSEGHPYLAATRNATKS